MDSNINEDTLQEVSEATALLTLTGWPYTNDVGSCWCGHSKEGHTVNPDDYCLTCGCVGFVLDAFIKEI